MDVATIATTTTTTETPDLERQLFRARLRLCRALGEIEPMADDISPLFDLATREARDAARQALWQLGEAGDELLARTWDAIQAIEGLYPEDHAAERERAARLEAEATAYAAERRRAAVVE